MTDQSPQHNDETPPVPAIPVHLIKAIDQLQDHDFAKRELTAAEIRAKAVELLRLVEEH